MVGHSIRNLFIPGDFLASVVSTYYTFENNFGIQQLLTKSLKRSCGLGSDQHFFFKFITENFIFF